MEGPSFDNHLENNINSFNKVSGSSDASSARARQLDELTKLQQVQKKAASGNVSAKELTNLYQKLTLPEYKNNVISTLLNQNNSILDAVMMDLISILGAELGNDMGGIDVLFLTKLINRLDEMAKNSPNPEYSKSLKNILQQNLPNIDDSKGIQAKLLKAEIQQTLQGINSKDIPDAKNTPKTQPQGKLDGGGVASTKAPVIGPMNQMQFPIKEKGFTLLDKDTMVSPDKNIVVKSNDGITAMADILRLTKDGGFIHALANLENLETIDPDDLKPFIAAIIQIGKIVPLFFVSQIVTQFMVHLAKLSANDKRHRLAIVTDNVTSLREIDKVDYIRKVSPSPNMQESYYHAYQSLFDEGYHFIISLHLNPNLKKTFRAASAAKKNALEGRSDDYEVHVHNTNANGVGLGLIIYELVQAIEYGFSPLEVNQAAKQLSEMYKHWVCPLEFDFVKNHQWVMKLADNQKKVQMRLFHFVPVIELDKELKIISVSYTKESAFVSLINALDQEVKNSNRKINRICVEYRGVYRLAIKLRNQIKVKYPNTKVSLHSVGTLTTQLLGPELLGVCVI